MFTGLKIFRLFYIATAGFLDDYIYSVSALLFIFVCTELPCRWLALFSFCVRITVLLFALSTIVLMSTNLGVLIVFYSSLRCFCFISLIMEFEASFRHSVNIAEDLLRISCIKILIEGSYKIFLCDKDKDLQMKISSIVGYNIIPFELVLFRLLKYNQSGRKEHYFNLLLLTRDAFYVRIINYAYYKPLLVNIWSISHFSMLQITHLNDWRGKEIKKKNLTRHKVKNLNVDNLKDLLRMCLELCDDPVSQLKPLVFTNKLLLNMNEIVTALQETSMITTESQLKFNQELKNFLEVKTKIKQVLDACKTGEEDFTNELVLMHDTAASRSPENYNKECISEDTVHQSQKKLDENLLIPSLEEPMEIIMHDIKADLRKLGKFCSEEIFETN